MKLMFNSVVPKELQYFFAKNLKRLLKFQTYVHWREVNHVVSTLPGDSQLCFPRFDVPQELGQHGLALDAVQGEDLAIGAAPKNGVHKEEAAAANILAEKPRRRNN